MQINTFGYKDAFLATPVIRKIAAGSSGLWTHHAVWSKAAFDLGYSHDNDIADILEDFSTRLSAFR